MAKGASPKPASRPLSATQLPQIKVDAEGQLAPTRAQQKKTPHGTQNLSSSVKQIKSQLRSRNANRTAMRTDGSASNQGELKDDSSQALQVESRRLYFSNGAVPKRMYSIPQKAPKVAAVNIQTSAPGKNNKRTGNKKEDDNFDLMEVHIQNQGKSKHNDSIYEDVGQLFDQFARESKRDEAQNPTAAEQEDTHGKHGLQNDVLKALNGAQKINTLNISEQSRTQPLSKTDEQ